MTTPTEIVRKFKVGDLVTTDFDIDHKTLVRKITRIEKNEEYGSGYKIWADGGCPCPCCGRTFAEPINGVDGAWFVPKPSKDERRRPAD